MTPTTVVDALKSRTIEVVKQDTGATATEYALLVAFIAIAIVVGVTLFGTALNNFFTDLATRVGLL